MDEYEIPKNRRPVKVKDVDRETVWRLACMQCTLREIADVVGISHDAVRKNFGDLIEKGKSVGKKSLRRAQWDKALNGDTRMQIFLGKNYLSQQETPENTSENQPLPWDED
jgi:hypothetical protein